MHMQYVPDVRVRCCACALAHVCARSRTYFHRMGTDPHRVSAHSACDSKRSAATTAIAAGCA
eukprot:3663446-Alexandrium_andersonii.AAC.1